MRVDQIIPARRYWNDISPIVSAAQQIINHLGFDSDILTEAMPAEERENIIYHMYVGSRPAETLAGFKAKRTVLFYHGIIPSEFFENHEAQTGLQKGAEQLKTLKNHFELAITTTRYLAEELHGAGFQQTVVLPPPPDTGKNQREPDRQLLRTYDDDYTNILFVGEITPNKKIEDTISIFNYYHKKYNPRSRLFLVGGFSAHPGYCQQLLDLIKELDIKNVCMTGRVSPAQLLAYYRLSRVFMCMSEYEGFSVPLVEAMHMKIPIIAFDRAAVPEILGGAGYLINEKDVRETARLLDRIVNDQTLREDIISGQTKRAAGFLPERVFPLYRQAIMQVFFNQSERGFRR